MSEKINKIIFDIFFLNDPGPMYVCSYFEGLKSLKCCMISDEAGSRNDKVVLQKENMKTMVNQNSLLK